VKNEKLHASKGCVTVVMQVVNGDKNIEEKKIPTICCNIPFIPTRAHDDRF
jgi:hypothetical protein